MERSSNSSDSSYAVKHEPECLFNQQVPKTEIVVEVEHIKQELEWEDRGSYDESESLEQSNLYADHNVKDEFVLGPEGLQPPDIAFTLYTQALAAKQHKLKDCVVMLERIDVEAHRPSTATATLPSKRESLTSDTHSTDLPYEYSDTNTEKDYYICAICNWKFKLKSRLKEHVMVHIHGSMEEESNVEFVLSAETADDRNSHHYEHAYAQIENPLPEVIAFECGTCNKKYDSVRQLKRHERTHPRVKPYSSSMADKTLSESEEEIDVVSLGPQIPLALSPDPPSGRRHRRVRQKWSKWIPSATVATAATARYELRARWHTGFHSDSDTDTFTIRRETHNVKERFRRDHLRKLFTELRKQIPKIKDKNGASKILIIKEATVLCHELREEQKCLGKQQHELMTEFKKLRSRAMLDYNVVYSLTTNI